MVNFLVSILSPLTIVSNIFMKTGTYALMFIVRVYKTPFLDLLCTESTSFIFRVDVDSPRIPSFLLLRFSSIFVSGGFQSFQMCRKELPMAQHPLEYRFLHLHTYFLFDSNNFCAPISVFGLNISSYRALLANTPNQTETLLHSLERAAAGIGLHVNAHKTEYMCYNQTGDICTLDGTSLKLVDKFTYLGSSVSSTEKDIDTRLTKAWTPIDKLSIIWK